MCLFYSILTPMVYAMPDDGGGQIIQIYTRFNSFIGRPSWLLVIRDVDHDENMPYVFDIDKENNFWVALTRGRKYLILISNLQISTYKSHLNRFQKFRINNFCGLESRGRIIRGESMTITIEGDLTRHPDTVNCYVSRYPDSIFPIAPQSLN